jgi:HK97 family phage major capsid protein
VGVSESQRAYATFHVKSIDDERRLIRGIASTPTLDRGGDVMASAGAKFTLPMPFRWEHKSTVGEVFEANVTAEGIQISARIPTIPEAGQLKDLVDFAWQSIKYKLARGLSIGWRPIEATRNTHGGLDVKTWEWFETSAVSIPMNADATIQLIKSLDVAHLAAQGTRSRIVVPPGASGSRQGHAMTISEQLTTAKTDLQTKSARLEELMGQDTADGGLEATESAELDTLTTEVKTLTKSIDRLSALEAAQSAQAKTVAYTSTTQATTPQQNQAMVKELPKGTLYTRYAMAVAAGKGSYSDTLEYAKQFSGTPVVAQMVKYFRLKAVEGTSIVQSPGWGGELVNPNTAQTEFVELLMPETIIGKVQGFDRVPFNIPIITQTGGSTFEWVDEGAPKPVGELAFTRDTMGHSKAAGIIVMTEELVRLSTPSAEARARQDLINQCRKFLDEQFIRVAVTAGTESPASITNGVTSPAASGTDVDALKADLVTAFGTFTGASIPLSGLVIVMPPDLALGISLLTNALGQTPAGFNVTPNGGTLLGYQVIVSESVDSGTIVIFKPSEIFLADDGEVRIDASSQATLDMNGGDTPTFNLWQRNCVGLRAERWINWKKKRANVVAVIDTAAYGPSVGSP